jgi:hypothetical protein
MQVVAPFVSQHAPAFPLEAWQTPCDAVQATGAQLPWTQNWPAEQAGEQVPPAANRHSVGGDPKDPVLTHMPGEAGHCRPHCSQFSGSCERSAQAPLQHLPGFVIPNGEVAPPPKAQMSPVAPGAQVADRQRLVLQKVPAGQLPLQPGEPASGSLHAPAQWAPGGQSAPHLPQWRASLLGSTQAPSQHAPTPPSGSGQLVPDIVGEHATMGVHVPPLQNSFAVHALSQAPQWSWSALTLLQVRPQHRLTPGPSQGCVSSGGVHEAGTQRP